MIEATIEQVFSGIAYYDLSHDQHFQRFLSVVRMSAEAWRVLGLASNAFLKLSEQLMFRLPLSGQSILAIHCQAKSIKGSNRFTSPVRAAALQQVSQSDSGMDNITGAVFESYNYDKILAALNVVTTYCRWSIKARTQNQTSAAEISSPIPEHFLCHSTLLQALPLLTWTFRY